MERNPVYFVPLGHRACHVFGQYDGQLGAGLEQLEWRNREQRLRNELQPGSECDLRHAGSRCDDLAWLRGVERQRRIRGRKRDLPDFRDQRVRGAVHLGPVPGHAGGPERRIELHLHRGQRRAGRGRLPAGQPLECFHGHQRQCHAAFRACVRWSGGARSRFVHQCPLDRLIRRDGAERSAVPRTP